MKRSTYFVQPSFWLGFGSVFNLSGGISQNLPAPYQGETDLETIVNDSLALKDDFDRMASDYAQALENIVNKQTN